MSEQKSPHPHRFERVYSVMDEPVDYAVEPSDRLLYESLNYDANGLMMLRNFRGFNAKDSFIESFEYDPEGRKTGMYKTYDPPEFKDLDVRVEYKYNDHLAEELRRDKDGNVKERIIYLHNHLGQLYQKNFNHGMDTLNYMQQFTYFKDGQLAEEYSIKNHRCNGHQLFAYDEAGHKISMISYQDYNRYGTIEGVDQAIIWNWKDDLMQGWECEHPTTKDKFTSAKTYNEKGQMISENRVKNGKVEFTIYYVYDDLGRLIERRWENLPGKVSSRMVHYYSDQPLEP